MSLVGCQLTRLTLIHTITEQCIAINIPTSTRKAREQVEKEVENLAERWTRKVNAPEAGGWHSFTYRA